MFVFCINLSFAETITGKVVSVIDGDTIELLSPNRKLYRIRLDSIDCPEHGQNYGTAAKQFTSQFTFKKEAKADISKKDVYGRYLGKVYVNNICLNSELVRNGFAWHYKKYSTDSGLTTMEESAKSEKKGMWKDRNNIPPWEYRQNNHIQNDSIDKVVNTNKPVEEIKYGSSVTIIPKGDRQTPEYIFEDKEQKNKADDTHPVIVNQGYYPNYGSSNYGYRNNYYGSSSSYSVESSTHSSNGYGALNKNGVPKTQWVNPYTKKDGTHVDGYYRAPANSNSVGKTSSSNGPKNQYVRPYTRKDGTHVKGYFRSSRK
jgi:endonuclease YncB( thermonuclease family)